MLQYSALRLRAVAHTAITTMSAAAKMPVTIHCVDEDVRVGGDGARAATTPACPSSAAAACNAVDDGKDEAAAEASPPAGVPA